MKESDLYIPVKTYLETLGYKVRAEVGKCDAVAVRTNEISTQCEMVAVELKLNFGLPVLYQALQRLPAFDLVYVAVAVPEGRVARENFDNATPDAIRLCRMLGLGLLSFRDGRIVVLCDPGVYIPHKSKTRRAKLLSEFNRRTGDHNLGGTTRRPRITAYREDALRCVRVMAVNNHPMRPVEIKQMAGVERAAIMLRGDVYGWFKKTGYGQYGLSANGILALETYRDVVNAQIAAVSHF